MRQIYERYLERALRDNKITPEEVQQILRAYSLDIQSHNETIENILSKHGHDVRLNQGYNQGLLKFTQSSLRATKQQENEVVKRIRRKIPWNHGTRQKLAWLSIVGPAALVSLFRLLQVM